MRFKGWSSLLAGAGHALSEVVQLSAGMSGLFLTRLTRLRVGVSSFSVLAWLLLAASGFRPSLNIALALFAALYLVRYAFLFLSFVPGGFAPWLKGRYGSERGFALYEAATAALLFFRGLSFIWLLDASYVPAYGAATGLVVTCGAVCLAVGTLITLWATHVVGLGTFYYRDLFLGERYTEVKHEGPYEFLENPMYGFGQLAAYGAALMALSPIGVLAAALNQATLYAFNWLVEQPHVRAATQLSVDVALREDLAHTVEALDVNYSAWGGPVEWNFAPGTPRRAVPLHRDVPPSSRGS
jgi:protein-S-isoprenylcysteine O-methyltransferase Ste14